MSITVSFTGNTLDELYASVAAFLDRPVIATGTQVHDPRPAMAEGKITANEARAAVGLSPVTTAAADDDDAPASGDAPEFDKGGIPWDQRIHSSSKALNEDGTWRKRRGVQDVYYASVMAELSNRTPGQQPAAAAPVAPVTASPAAPVGVVDQGPVVIPPVAVAPATAAVVPSPVMAAPAATIPAVPSAPAAPAAPVAPAETAPVVPVAEPAGMGFDTLMPKVSAAIQAGKFTNEQLNTWVTTPAPDGWGLANITQLAADRMKTQQFHDWLKSSGLID